MKNDFVMKVVTEKLREEEKFVFSSLPSVKKEDLDNIELYNQANYFLIKKLYLVDKLKGYAIFFLGYHGLDSNDVSLERVCFPENEALSSYFAGEVVKNEGFPFLVEKIYCLDTRLNEQEQELLKDFGVIFPSRVR